MRACSPACTVHTNTQTHARRHFQISIYTCLMVWAICQSKFGIWTKTCKYDQLTNSSSAWPRVKETKHIPETLISSHRGQRTSAAPYCTSLRPFPPSYLPRRRIRKGASAQSKEFLLWLFLSYCFVTVKAAGERVEAQRCVQTWNTTILTLLKAEKLCTSSVESREIPAGGKTKNKKQQGKQTTGFVALQVN